MVMVYVFDSIFQLALIEPLNVPNYESFTKIYFAVLKIILRDVESENIGGT